ncbi:hypothetical protein Taro_038009 [Colocasia esculenta]|uniref:Uncharacterized protein n=1 Tax=Colocasia esculenta TaxID=4460 RepID=A0A843W727_COLES|nr:hypothetical protein [Colocasia esculenta]
MGKMKAALAGRAWKLLRMALFWARKGGIFRRGLLQDLRLVPHQVKSLWAARFDAIHIGEREFSLDETPIFHFKMSRPRPARMLHIPCINPRVDFDDEEDVFLFKTTSFGRRSYNAYEEEEAGDGDGDTGDALADEDSLAVIRGGEEVVVEECIDVKAEEFIVKFYEQMKLQRQISFLQYNEMLTN